MLFLNHDESAFRNRDRRAIPGRMSAKGPACVKTCASQECGEWFFFIAFSRERHQNFWFSERTKSRRIFYAKIERPCFHTALYGNTSVKVHPARSSPFLLSNMNDPREARLLARCAPQPCIRLSRHRPETMKQSFASTARLRGGGPILGTASIPWLCSGLHHLGS